MISIKNLNIEYKKRVIIENGSMDIPEGKITMLIDSVDLEKQRFYII